MPAAVTAGAPLALAPLRKGSCTTRRRRGPLRGVGAGKRALLHTTLAYALEAHTKQRSGCQAGAQNRPVAHVRFTELIEAISLSRWSQGTSSPRPYLRVLGCGGEKINNRRRPPFMTGHIPIP